MNKEQKCEFYCDGTLKSKGEYLLGTSIRTGKWKNYFPNGRVESEGEYENDSKIGEWIFYHETGNFKCSKIFKNGRQLKKVVGADEDETDNL